MEFTIVRGADAPEIGLHQADRYDVVLDIERCHLQSDTMNTLLAELRAQARARRLSVYDQDSGAGLLRFATVREGRRTGEAMMNIVAAAPDVETLTPVAEELRARVPALASVVLNVNAKKASVAVGTEEHLLLGRDHIRESLGGLTFQVSASSFFQTNTVQAERLFAVVEAACEFEGNETVMDLYSGTGAISLLLARRSRWVYGIEVSSAAVADAVRNARENGIENCTFLPGEVRHVLPTLMRDGVRADVVVADPLEAIADLLFLEAELGGVREVLEAAAAAAAEVGAGRLDSIRRWRLDGLDHRPPEPRAGLDDFGPHPVARDGAADEEDVALDPPNPLAPEGEVVDRQIEDVTTPRFRHD